MDERFNWPLNQKGISKWLRNHVQKPENYDKFDLKMRAFFQQMNARGFIPKVKQLEQLNVEIEEGEDKVMKINSKKKIDNNPKV